jgi:hypothetical protein
MGKDRLRCGCGPQVEVINWNLVGFNGALAARRGVNVRLRKCRSSSKADLKRRICPTVALRATSAPAFFSFVPDPLSL